MRESAFRCACHGLAMDFPATLWWRGYAQKAFCGEHEVRQNDTRIMLKYYGPAIVAFTINFKAA
jgi:hypothetical protein